MAENSNIEWCSHTFNAWIGCTKISAGCANCYASTMDENRFSRTLGGGTSEIPISHWGKNATRHVTGESNWKEPLKWNRAAEGAIERPRVFCASLSDVFEGRDTMPDSAWGALKDARIRLWKLIDETPNLDWLLLTKRPENVMSLIPFRWESGLPANVWLGTSVENQATADERIPHLLQVPAKVRFLSCEPLLGAVDLFDVGPLHHDVLRGWKPAHGDFPEGCNTDNIDWIIAGGESGPNARAFHPTWARGLRDQCEAAGVPFLFKQWGEWAPDCVCGGGCAETTPPFHRVQRVMFRCGKKRAGRLLDGREWNEFPEVAR